MIIEAPIAPVASYALRRADDALILGHRLSEWTGKAPILEEEMALANMALDLIGQSRVLYSYAAEIEGKGHTEDDFAYLRRERDYRNILLVERPNGDFAHTMLRQFFFAAFMYPYWRAMMASKDATLGAIAAKAEKEIAYHLRHSTEWVMRLGDGTAESHRRLADALADLWAYTGELFEADADEQALIAQGILVDPETLRTLWTATVSDTLTAANLDMPQAAWMQTGGRHGQHSENLGHLLSELQYMQRMIPGAVW